MKAIKIMIVFFMIVCNFSAFAEGKTKDKENEIQAPKKAWKIIIKNNLSTDDNFALVGRILIENDYTIDKKDKEFGTIETAKSKIFKNRAGSYLLNISVKNNVITLTGKWSADIELVLYGAN